MKDQQDPVSMDQAAYEAAADLARLEQQPSMRIALVPLRAWWTRHYATAGHRRLARVLLGRFGKAPP